MCRRAVVMTGLSVLLISGCGGNSAPPAPSGGAASTPPSSKPALRAKIDSPAAAPAVPAAKSTVSPHRDLLTRYLESDGQGGWRTNESAATDLEKLNAEQVAQVWPLLRDEQAAVRRGAAVFLLTQFDPGVSDQVAAFTDLLDDADAMIRARAVEACRQFSRGDQVATLPAIVSQLDPNREDRTENRIAILRFCSALKNDAMPVISVIQTAASGDPAANVRSMALVAISQIAPSQTTVPVLVIGLADADASVRLVAAARLRQLRDLAAPAANELAAALGDTDSRVAEAAAEALIAIGPSAVSSLASQLNSNNAPVRKLALACLAKIGPAANPAKVHIEKCRQDPDPQVRQLAEAALKRISGQGQSR